VTGARSSQVCRELVTLARMAQLSSTARPRRTQEERSTATRLLILEATIDTLVELGYAATSTTAIAERAGVSRGAQMHHYPTKADLVAAAVEHLGESIRQELSSDVERRRRSSDDNGAHPAVSSIEALWSRYSSPLFQAWVELWVAARTDEDLRAVLAPTEQRFRNAMRSGLPDLFGVTETTEGIAEVWSLTFYLLQGMAFERALGMEDRATRERREERALAAWKAFVAGRGARG
jgi:AcrR family transcriptional regulator